MVPIENDTRGATEIVTSQAESVGYKQSTMVKNDSRELTMGLESGVLTSYKISPFAHVSCL